MPEELTNLPPEDFLRLAVARGGLELDDVLKDLSPQAAKALGLIVLSSTSTSPGSGSKDVSRSASAPVPVYRSAEPQAVPCPKCGHTGQPGNQYCTRCGHGFGQGAAPTTLDHLVEQGHLTGQEADEALAAILLHQSHYPAGTRYSIFGGSISAHAQNQR